MKNICAAAGLILITIASIAQPSNIPVRSAEITVGRVFATQTEIKAKERIFPERIHRFYIDAVSGFAMLQLRALNKSGKHLKNSGQALYYDLNGERVKWSKRMYYRANFIRQSGNMIFFNSGNMCYRLNTENGKSLWETGNSLTFLDYAAGVGFGFKRRFITGKYDLFQGIDLNPNSAKIR